MSGPKSKEIDRQWADLVTPELTAVVQGASEGGRVTCSVLRRIAEDADVSYRVAGAAADAAGIRVRSCDLGCF